jgi:tetratricopeptide (TPR) repeat protein
MKKALSSLALFGILVTGGISYAIETAEGVKIGAGDAYNYRLLGDSYKEKGDKKKAKEYYMKAYELYKSIGADSEAQDTLDEIKKLDKKKIKK